MCCSVLIRACIHFVNGVSMPFWLVFACVHDCVAHQTNASKAVTRLEVCPARPSMFCSLDDSDIVKVRVHADHYTVSEGMIFPGARVCMHCAKRRGVSLRMPHPARVRRSRRLCATLSAAPVFFARAFGCHMVKSYPRCRYLP